MPGSRRESWVPPVVALIVEALPCAVATGKRSPAGLSHETLLVIRYLDRDQLLPDA